MITLRAGPTDRVLKLADFPPGARDAPREGGIGGGTSPVEFGFGVAGDGRALVRLDASKLTFRIDEARPEITKFFVGMSERKIIALGGFADRP